MVSRFIHNANAVWLFLVAVTLISWLLFEDTDWDFAIYLIVVLSSLKVYLIGLSYMEVLRANPVFIHAFHIWVIGVSVMFLTFKAVHF